MAGNTRPTSSTGFKVRPVHDDEKEMVSVEFLAGESNSFMVSTSDGIEAVQHYNEKEVAPNHQLRASSDSAPTPVYSPGPAGDLMNDIKGPPPSYDTLTTPTRVVSDDSLTRPLSLQPDGSSLSTRPEDRSAVGQLLSWIPPAPSLHPTQMPPLFQPIIIPQIDVPPQGESVPFARCYTDALASHGIPMREFLAFLDGLAVAQSPNATLQGVRMFGTGASHVPIPFMGLAANGIRALASIGSGHSGSRARLYLERAKRDYFAPRGLRIAVVKDGDLNFRLQVPPHAPRLAPLTKSTVTNSLCERRLEGVAPYVSPLRYNVPPEDAQMAGVHRLARKHLQRQIKRDANTLADLRQEQWLDVSSAGPRQKEWEARYAGKMAELRHCQMSLAQGLGALGDSKEGAQQLAQLQRDVQILVSERQVMMQNFGGAVEAEMEEDNWSRRLKWIVIENLE